MSELEHVGQKSQSILAQGVSAEAISKAMQAIQLDVNKNSKIILEAFSASFKVF